MCVCAVPEKVEGSLEEGGDGNLGEGIEGALVGVKGK